MANDIDGYVALLEQKSVQGLSFPSEQPSLNPQQDNQLLKPDQEAVSLMMFRSPECSLDQV